MMRTALAGSILLLVLLSCCFSILFLSERGPGLSPSLDKTAAGYRKSLFFEREPSESAPKKVAVAISITRITHEKYGDDYLDLCGVLAQSVYNWSTTSRHRVELIAFVPKSCPENAAEKLSSFGFAVIPKDLPILLSDLPDGQYKEKVDSSGCCGLAEFMKLYAYTLTNFDRVLHLDTDMYIRGNIDQLFENKYEKYSLLYTNSTLSGEILSGGFLLIQPSMEIFEELKSIVRSGNFTRSKGWNNSGIGKSWGGETVQGVIPYYYLHQANSKQNALLLDRCVWNRQGSEFCENSNTSIYDAKVVHMTICQKPLKCAYQSSKETCRVMHEEWWIWLNSLRERLGYPPVQQCRRFKKIPYRAIPLPQVRSEVSNSL